MDKRLIPYRDLYMTTFEKLNSMLQVFVDNKFKQQIDLAYLYKECGKMGIELGEVSDVLRKLLKDEYLEKIEYGTKDTDDYRVFYKVSFNGLMFNEQGGYKNSNQPPMTDYNYEILKILVSSGGQLNIDTLMSHITKDVPDDELVEKRRSFASAIISMTLPEYKYIRTINFTANTGLGKYLDTRRLYQEQEDNSNDDKMIVITTEGRRHLVELKELFDPTPPVAPQRFEIKDSPHAIIATGGLTMRDNKSNDESKESKDLTKKTLEDFPKVVWYRRQSFIWLIVATLLAVVMLIIALT